MGAEDAVTEGAGLQSLREKPALSPKIRESRRAHRRSLGSPRFAVESCSFGKRVVVLFKENHISGVVRAVK
jgi:hypothetical protein